MQQLEPTYLRYVYDGLSKGSISSNNPTSLPIGFIGLFEDEFPSSMTLVERMSILNRLATWALLKGPVSVEMVAEVLNEHPDNTKALVDTYSKWFNSPEPGKYVLYHDRLRTYLLQKLSNHEVQDLNETLISYLENALNSEDLKEAESYALEHLSTHMLIESQMGNNYERLHEFVNQEDLWKRQIITSNEYKWSQRSVQYGIKEGARRRDDNRCLESSINKFKLRRIELEEFNRLFNFIEKEQYEIVINRLDDLNENFKFKICVVILFEILIGSFSKNKIDDNFVKQIVSILKLVKDDNKNSYNWVDFFPVSFMFKIHVLLKQVGIDTLFLWIDEEIDFKKIINHDYGDMTSKKMWFSELIEIIDTKPISDAHHVAYVELIKFKIKNGFYEYAKQDVETISVSIIPSLNDSKNIEKLIEKYLKSYKEIFNCFDKNLFKHEVLKSIFFNNLFDKLNFNKSIEETLKEFNFFIQKADEVDCLDNFLRNHIEISLLELFSISSKNVDTNQLKNIKNEISVLLFNIQSYEKSQEFFEESKFAIKYLNVNKNIDFNKKIEKKCTEFIDEFISLIQHKSFDDVLQLFFSILNTDNFNFYIKKFKQSLVEKFELEKPNFSIRETFDLFKKLNLSQDLKSFNSKVVEELINKLHLEKNYEIDLGQEHWNEVDQKVPYPEPRGVILDKLSNYFAEQDKLDLAIDMVNQFKLNEEFSTDVVEATIMNLINKSYLNVDCDGTYSKVLEFIKLNLNHASLNLNQHLLEDLILFKLQPNENISNDLFYSVINNQIEKFIEYNFIIFESEFNKVIIDNHLINNLDKFSYSNIFYELISSVPKDRGVLSEINAFELSESLISINMLSNVESIIDKTVSPIYKYYISMRLIKSLIKKGDLSKAIDIASSFDLIIFKKNLLQICYIECKINKVEKKHHEIIDKLITLSESNQSKILFLSSIYDTIMFFGNSIDIEYFLKNLTSIEKDEISTSKVVNKLNVFIIGDQILDSKIDKGDIINIKKLNTNFSEFEIDEKIKQFDNKLYSSQPLKNSLENGSEILLYFYHNEIDKFDSFSEKIISFVFKDTTGWYYYSQIIHDIVDLIISDELNSFLKLENLCQIAFLVEDNELRSSSFIKIFQKFSRSFINFEEILELDLVIDFLINSENNFSESEISDIIIKFKELEGIHAKKLLHSIDFNLKESKKILERVSSIDKKSISKLIFENEFLRNNKIHKDLILFITNVETEIVNYKLDFISTNYNLNQSFINYSSFSLLKDLLIKNNLYSGELKEKLIAELVINNTNINEYDIISQNYNISNLNKALSNISILLAKNKSFNKSINLLNLMANDESNWLLSDGGVDDAFTIESAQDALGIANDEEVTVLKTITSEKICKELIKINDVDKAIIVANNIEILVNRIYLFHDLIDQLLIISKNQSDFSIVDLKKLFVNKSKAFYYEYYLGPVDYNTILNEYSHKVCNDIRGLIKNDKSYINIINELSINRPIYVQTPLSFDDEQDFFSQDKLSDLSDYEILYYFNKGINLADSALEFHDYQMISNSKSYFHKSLKVYNTISSSKALRMESIHLLAEMSFKLFLLTEKLDSKLSKVMMEETINWLLDIRKEDNDNYWSKNFINCSKMDFSITKKKALNSITIQILNYYLESKDSKNFLNIMMNYLINDKNENLVMLNKRKDVRLDRIKRLTEIKAPEAILLNEQKLIDEAISGIVTLKCGILNELKTHQSSEIYQQIIKELINEDSLVCDLEIVSSNNYELAKLLVNLNNENDYYFSELLEISEGLKFQYYEELCCYSLDILTLNKVVSLLKINEQIFNNGSFIKKNIEKFEKCFEIDNYSFLSNFHLNQSVCNYFVSNSFKINFNTNKELSLFDKLFETQLYQELNDIISET